MHIFFKKMHYHFFFVHMNVICDCTPKKPGESIAYPEAIITSGYGCWKQSLGPLQVQQEPFTAEMVLQHLVYGFFLLKYLVDFDTMKIKPNLGNIMEHIIGL